MSFDLNCDDRLIRSSLLTGLSRPKQESPHIRESCSSNHRQLLTELEDQLNTCKAELKRKEEIIKQITSIEVQPRYSMQSKFDSTKLDSVLNGDRYALENARQELLSLHTKLDQQNQQLLEAKHSAESRQAEANRYRLEIDAMREADSRNIAIIDALKQRICDLEGENVHFESTAGRTKIVVEQVQRENSELKDRISELEERLKVHLMERENVEQNFSNVEKKHMELLIQLRSIVHVDDPCAATETILRKISEIAQSNAMDRTKGLRLQDEIEALRLEDKANRETIQRLVAEVAREQKSTIRISSDTEKLRQERDDALTAKIDIEREVDILRDRLDHMQRQYDSARAELESYLNKAQSFERDAREASCVARNASTQFSSFCDQLSSLLGTGYATVQPTEEDIKKHVGYLKDANKDKDTHIVLLKEKLENLRSQFEEQYKLQNISHEKSRSVEQENAELAERLRRLENDISANDVMRDGLRSDREKYLRFLEQISTVLKMDRISADMGLELALDAILVRGEQLVKLENEAIASKTTHVYSLQRKLKAMKEQLESKDLHLDLLRKKVTQLEERVTGRGEIERERNVESQRVFKLEKLVERYRSQFEAAKCEINDLKSQLFGTNEIRNENIQSSQQLNTYELELREMRDLNDQQAKKIAFLKRELQNRGCESEEKITEVDGIVRQLNDDNRQMKITMQELRDREQELLDQRQVIARMLGLDAQNLAIPAYEIIERLRRLIEASHASCLAAASSQENLIETMDDAFRAGYESGEVTACRTNSFPPPIPLASGPNCCPPPVPPAPHPGTRTTYVRRRVSPPPPPMETRHSKRKVFRARSVSPMRRVDPRAY